MARTPRPIDPEEGPVQAFAQDLRVLREAIGNPTYRALAKTAGFSATTLGDAAGGVRLPSLEVALAYVGACGGDTEAWRIRWQDLSRQLAAERGSAEITESPRDAGSTESSSTDADSADAAATGDRITAAGDNAIVPATSAGAELDPSSGSGSSDQADLSAAPEAAASEVLEVPAPTEEPEESEASETIGSRPRTSRRRRRLLVGAGTVVVVAALLAWRLPAMDRSSAAPVTGRAALTLTGSSIATTGPADCPASGPAPGTFPGSTYEQATKVRAGASTDAAVQEQIPAGCTLRFTGYCIGEVVASGFSGSPDMRWFELSGGGVISSAILHGDPPPGMPPSQCPGDVPPPSSLELSAAAGPVGTVTFLTTGSHVWIVGFAAFYPGAPGETPQWHQLAIINIAMPSAIPQLTAAAIAAAKGTGGIPVFADACFGGGSPTPVYASDTLDPTDPTGLKPSALSPADLTAAEMKACSYPGTN